MDNANNVMSDRQPDFGIDTTVAGEHHHPWYAIHVQSKFERVTSAILRDHGFEHFLPLHRVKRSWSDRVKQLDVPCSPATSSAASTSRSTCCQW